MNQKQKPHAIVLDDDEGQATGIANQLRAMGFDATATFSVVDAKAAIGARRSGAEVPRIDLLVVDYDLSASESGLDFVSRLFQEGNVKLERVTLLTGHDLAEEHKQLAETWKIAIVRKPKADLATSIVALFPDLDGLLQSRDPDLGVQRSPIVHEGSEHEGVKWTRRGAIWGAIVGVITIALTIAVWFWPKADAPLSSPDVTLAINPVPLASVAIVADTEALWGKVRLNVRTQRFKSGKEALTAVIGGGADFATVAETPIVRATLAKHRLALLATIAASPEDCKACYRSDLGISTPVDLRGKKVATAQGTSAEFFMHRFLAHHGIRPDEVQAINMAAPDMPSALARGDISAFFIFEPYPLKARQLIGGKAKTFSGSQVYKETFHIVTTQEKARDQSGRCKDFLRALIAAENIMEGDKDSAIAKVAKFTELNEADLKLMWPDFQFRVGLEQETIDLMNEVAKWVSQTDNTPLTKNDFTDVVFPGPLTEIDPSRVRLDPAKINP